MKRVLLFPFFAVGYLSEIAFKAFCAGCDRADKR